MEQDLEMLAGAELGRIAARVYRWHGLWVTLGNSQCARDVLIQPDQTRWVTRPTGGLAVLHGHDLTVSLAIPAKLLVAKVSTYRTMTRALVLALNDCGVQAAPAEDVIPETVEPSSADCFAVTSRNDIVERASAQKLCGCALRRTRLGVLLQASIPIGEPLAPPSSVIRGGVSTGYTAIDPKRLTESLAMRLDSYVLSKAFFQGDTHSK